MMFDRGGVSDKVKPNLNDEPNTADIAALRATVAELQDDNARLLELSKISCEDDGHFELKNVAMQLLELQTERDEAVRQAFEAALDRDRHKLRLHSLMQQQPAASVGCAEDGMAVTLSKDEMSTMDVITQHVATIQRLERTLRIQQEEKEIEQLTGHTEHHQVGQPSTTIGTAYRRQINRHAEEKIFVRNLSSTYRLPVFLLWP